MPGATTNHACMNLQIAEVQPLFCKERCCFMVVNYKSHYTREYCFMSKTMGIILCAECFCAFPLMFPIVHRRHRNTQRNTGSIFFYADTAQLHFSLCKSVLSVCYEITNLYRARYNYFPPSQIISPVPFRGL